MLNPKFGRFEPIGGPGGEADDDTDQLIPVPATKLEAGIKKNCLSWCVGLILSLTQLAGGVLGIYGANQLCRQTWEIKEFGFPIVFTSANFDLGRFAFLYIASAYAISSIGSILTFVYVTLHCCGAQVDETFAEIRSEHKVRQVGFGLADLLVAWSLYSIFGISPDDTLLDNELFGVDNLTIALPPGSYNASVYPKQVAVQLAFIVLRSSSSTLDLLLFAAACLRVAVVLVLCIGWEKQNVCYILPLWRCGYEWTREQKGVIPKYLDKYAMVFEKTFDKNGAKAGRGQRFWVFAAFWHNWLGSLRNWQYLSTVLFLLGIYFQWRGVVGPMDGNFWPQYRPANEPLALSDYFNNFKTMKADNATSNDDTALFNSILSQSGVFPRSYNTLDRTIDSSNDAGYLGYVAAILIFTAEVLRTVGAFAYFVGIWRGESSTPRSHPK